MKILLLVISISIACLSAHGQTADTCGPLITAIIEAKAATDRANAIGTLVKLGNHPLCFAEIVARSSPGQRAAYVTFLKNLELHRTDKQAGSSTGTGGTTSLVSKGVTAQAISIAAEYGALTESVSSQVVTVQGSLNGLPSTLIRQGLVSYCPNGSNDDQSCVHQSLLGILRRISYGISFNTSTNSQAITGMATGSQTGTAQMVTFTPTGNQISSVTGRFVLWNARDATSSTFQTRWTNALTASATTQSKTDASPTPSTSTGAASKASPSTTATTTTATASPTLLNSAGATLMSALENLIPRANNDIYTDWEERAMGALQAATPTDIASVWEQCGDQLVDLLEGKNSGHKCGSDPKEIASNEKAQFTDPNLADNAISFIQASSEYRFEEDEFVTAIADKPVLTLEYDYNQALSQIPTSTIRLIFDKGFGKNWSVTANGAFAIYDSSPSSAIPGAGRLRDCQIGIEVDRKLPALSFLGAATLAGTYYFQYQNSPSILNVSPSTPLPGIPITGLSGSATQVFATKGNLHIGQVKLMLGTGQSNVRFPVAFSYASRTDLLTKPEWRGQIGISYDLDSLFTR